MIYYKDFDYDSFKPDIKHNKKFGDFANNIFCFDIETTTAYNIDRVWKPYDYNIPSENYKEIPQYTFCYIWQFGIEENVVYGRNLQDFRFFLNMLVNKYKANLVIYVHNLGFEMEFLRNIFSDISVFARKPHHPMKFTVNIAEYVVEFRCSLVLTNQKLENIGKSNATYKKMVGDLDYNVLRFPDTELSEKEIGYCENDILVMWEYLNREKQHYGNRIDRIPLTQTGKVRKSLQAYYRKYGDYEKQNKKCQKLVPTLNEYKILNEVFSGGYVHSNPLKTGKIISNVKSKDLASAYPARMLCEKFPTSHFIKSPYKSVSDIPEDLLWIARIQFDDIESIKCFNYIQRSKISNCKNVVCENGRVERAETLQILVTNVDYEIIKKGYTWSKSTEKIIECYTAECGYLDTTYRNFILEMYVDKTMLKDVDGKEDLYARKKEELNGNFGQAVTNYVAPEIVFDEEWGVEELTDNKIMEILDKQRNSKTLLTVYSHGIYITAYNRLTLFKALYEVDYDGIYCDTDSVKYIGDYDYIFDKINVEIVNKLKKAMPTANLAPKDINGKARQIGVFETEKEYYKFITYGCKKYCYQYEENGEIFITLAGVNKSTFKKKENEKYNKLKSLDDFKQGLIFDEHCSGRLLATYINNQEPIEINGHVLYNKYAISLRPSTYELGAGIQFDKYLIYLAQANSGYYLGKKGNVKC